MNESPSHRTGPGRRNGDRAERPFRARRSSAPPKPSLPSERPFVAREVFRELKSAARPGEVDDVVSAYASAGEALAEGDVRRALQLLTWAKSAAARSGAIREALGVAHYHAGDYPAAQRELMAYRRLSGRQDQNHLLADCARAAGQPDKVAHYVEEMLAAQTPAERVSEGLIVLAGDRADRGDLQGALHTLERGELGPAYVEEHHVRLWYFAADLCARLGDVDGARDYLEAIAAVDPDYLDVGERLAALEA